jgi:hypothetical protein
MYIQCEEVKERKRQRKVETEVADLRYNCPQCCGSTTFWCGSGSGSGFPDPCL